MKGHFQEYLQCKMLIFYIQCYLFVKCSDNNNHFVHQTYGRNELNLHTSIISYICSQMTSV